MRGGEIRSFFFTTSVNEVVHGVLEGRGGVTIVLGGGFLILGSSSISSSSELVNSFSFSSRFDFYSFSISSFSLYFSMFSYVHV